MCTGQQHTLGLAGDAEHHAGIPGAAAFHLAQHHDRALAGGWLPDRRLPIRPQLPPADQPLRLIVSHSLGASTRCASGRDPESGTARTAQHDAEQPARQAGSALESVDAGVDSEPPVLHHRAGLGMTADDRGGDAHQRGTDRASGSGAGRPPGEPHQEIGLACRTLAHAALAFLPILANRRVTLSLAARLTKTSDGIQKT
jgi:hypothetical protein